MKFTAKIGNELKAIISFVQGSLKSRVKQDADTGVLNFLSVSADCDLQQVTVQSTSLDRNVSFTCKAHVEESGEMLYNADDLIALYKKAKNRGTYPAMTFADSKVDLCGRQGKITFHPAPSEVKCFNLPTSASVPADDWTLTAMRDLEFSASRVGYAASPDETKACLTGIYFDNRNGGSATATDGHRLATVLTGFAPVTPFVLSAKLLERKKDKISLPELVFALQEYSEEGSHHADIGVGGFGDVFFKRELSDRKFEISVRNLSWYYGNYPNYPQLLPVQFSKGILFARNNTLAAIEKIMPFIAAGESNAVTISWDKETQCFYLTGDGLPISGIKLDDYTSVLYGHEWFESSRGLSLNVNYLHDALSACNTLQVSLFANTETSACVLTSDRESEAHLLMPIQFREPGRLKHFELVKKFKAHFPAA